MYGVLWCNLNLICIAMKHPVHRRHLKLLAFTRTFNIFFISNAISSQLNTVNCKLHCTRVLKTEMLKQNVQFFLSNVPQYRVLWNNLAFKSFLCSLVCSPLQVRYPALSFIGLGFRYVTINFWSQYEYIYRASHSFDQWRFQR
jgi:hypothetical protein